MRYPTMKAACFLSALFLAMLLSAGVEAAKPPFQPGERLTFELRWAFVRAGEVVLEVRPTTTFESLPARHFTVNARTTRFVDNFYKVRDTITSFCDLSMTRSLHYHKQGQEGTDSGETFIDFDWNESTARHRNLERARDPIPVEPSTFDPLSIFYHFRTLDLENGKELTASVTDGKKHVLGQARVIDRQTVTVKAGTFDTFLVEPELKDVGGVFKKSPDAKLQIWVTADEYKVPVMIRSKVAVGHFTAELVSAEGVNLVQAPASARVPPRTHPGLGTTANGHR
jgi:hypothetical protein